MDAAPEEVPGFWTLARRRDVVLRGLKVAAVVGLILVAINHGAALLDGEFDASRGARILLTMAVPYCVSTWSSVAATTSRPGPSSMVCR